MEIYIKCNRKDFGPYSIEQLRELVEDGTFLPHDSASVGESNEWTIIKKLPGFLHEDSSNSKSIAEPQISCPYCRNGVSAEDSRTCSACGSPHHTECWRENGGCTVYGCPGSLAGENSIKIGCLNIETIRIGFQRAGWNHMRPGNHMGVGFDLVGQRRFMALTKWNVLVKVLPLLDQAAANLWRANFERISRSSKSWIWGRAFILCLLAEGMSARVSESLSADNFGLFGMFRLQGGGGNMLVADVKNKQVYGKVPSLPYDVHKFSQSAKEIIFHAINTPGLV